MRNRDFPGARELRLLLAASCFALTSCDKFQLPTSDKSHEQALEAEQAGDYPRAVRMYEAMLDGTARTADTHLQLALIYDDKLKDPVSALHHFRRYLKMTEDPSRKKEVGGYIERIELVLATRAAESGLMTKREAARLKNENLSLQNKLIELQTALAEERKRPKAPEPETKKSATASRDGAGFSKVPKTAAAERAVGKETRTYVVQKGDTLAAISRKFYKTAQRWKDIADANQNALHGSVNVQIGQTLIIPE